MSGKLTGVAAKIKKVAPECRSNLTLVLTDAVKVINFIKARAFNSRLFSLMYEDMGSKFRPLLFTYLLHKSKMAISWENFDPSL